MFRIDATGGPRRAIVPIPLRPVPEPAEPLIAAAPEPTVPQPATADVHAPADTVTPVAAALHPALSKIQLIATAEAAPAVVAPATSKQTPARPESKAQLAKVGQARQPRSLDRLISEIAESR